MNLLDLPYTIFLDIISYLPACEVIRCRRVSTYARDALTGQELSISLILGHFPLALEARILQRCIRSDDTGTIQSCDWSAVFARLTRRYLHLDAATPWRTLKIETLKDPVRIKGAVPWERFLRLDMNTMPFYHNTPVWALSPRDGLLVYPAPDGLGYQARDIGTGEQVAVPFTLNGRVVRRVKLNDGILIFEWCEKLEHHSRDHGLGVHRYFATAYDVRRRGENVDGAYLPRYKDGLTHMDGQLSLWSVKFRAEWLIRYAQSSPGSHDKYFSAHNATHYVLYSWQPMSTRWVGNAIEFLTVWEFGEPPSSVDRGHGAAGDDSGRPRVIQKLGNSELESWGILQGNSPSISGVHLDECTWDKHAKSVCGHVYFHEEDHRWSANAQNPSIPTGLHSVRSTGIPLQGDGPPWIDECGGAMESCWRGVREGGGVTSRQAWPGRAPCWRHDDFPYLTVSEVYDTEAGVRITARQCFMLETLSVHVRPELRVREEGSEPSRAKIEGPDGDEMQFGDSWWGELMGKRVICGDERWIVGEDEDGDVTVMIF